MEDLLHRTRPSQLLSLGAWGAALFASWVVGQAWPLAAELLWQSFHWRLPSAWLVFARLAPLGLGAWYSLVLFTTVYKVTDQRLMRRTGIFSVHWDEVELSRVLDYVVTQPFHLRIFGLGNLVIVSADKTTPWLKIAGQRRVRELRDGVRRLVLERQKATGHRELYSSHS